MDTISLAVQARDKSQSVKSLREQDLLPIEFYGKGVDNQSLQIDYQTFRRAFKVAGTNTVLELKVDDDKAVNAIVHDVHYHPVTDKMTHVDLMNVRMDVAITAKIPLHFVGSAPAVTNLGGTLNVNLHEIEIKCLPKYLLHEIEVSIEPIVDYSVGIRIEDLNLSDKIEILHDPEQLIVGAVPPTVEEEPEPAEGEEGIEMGAEGEGPGEGNEGSEEGESEGGDEEKSE